MTVGNAGTACQSPVDRHSPTTATVAEWSSSCTPGPVNVAPTITWRRSSTTSLDRALHPVAERVGPGHVPGAVLDGAYVEAALPRLALGQPDRAHLGVGEGDPGNHVLIGHVADVTSGDDIADESSLVLAHVGQQGTAIAVPHRVEPPAGHTDSAELLIDVDEPAGLEPDGLQAQRRRRRTPSHGDQDLVGLDVAAVGEGRDHRTIGAIAPRGGQGDTGDDGDALGCEGSRKLVTGEGLLPREEPRAGFDHRDLLAAEPAECLGHLGSDGAAAQHQQPAGSS